MKSCTRLLTGLLLLGVCLPAWAVERRVYVGADNDPVLNGKALRLALQTAASFPNVPFLIELGPGQYELGSSSLTLPRFVNLLGAGRSATEIRRSQPNSTVPVIYAAGNNELARLSLRSLCASSQAYCYGLQVAPNAQSVRVLDAFVLAQGANWNNSALLAGGNVELENVHLLAQMGMSANAVQMTGSGILLARNSRFGAFAASNESAAIAGNSNSTQPLQIEHSRIDVAGVGSARTFWIAAGLSVTPSFRYTQIYGGTRGSAAACMGVIGGSGFLTNTCPP